MIGFASTNSRTPATATPRIDMKILATIVSLAASVLLATASLAQAPANAPAGATGLCNDGTYWSNATKSGACSGHKGVKEWYGAAAPASSAAAPGGSTKVWANPKSKTYHCPGDRWYGATKSGKRPAKAVLTLRS